MDLINSAGRRPQIHLTVCVMLVAVPVLAAIGPIPASEPINQP